MASLKRLYILDVRKFWLDMECSSMRLIEYLVLQKSFSGEHTIQLMQKRERQQKIKSNESFVSYKTLHFIERPWKMLELVYI